MNKKYYVYIMTNRWSTALCTGFTNDLERRVLQYRRNDNKRNSFISRYYANKLVYFEEFFDAYEAIAREKQIKAGSRRKKVSLINTMNPRWNDLSVYPVFFDREIASVVLPLQ